MEEYLLQYMESKAELELKIEFQHESHDYLNCYVTDITPDEFVVFEVHYIHSEENAVEVSELLVPLDYVVRVATVKSSTKL